ncbi:glycosyltransferase family 4 protein [Rhodohalobacter sulfatireducens]|uniref:Glycosyltransferase family 4 protein n=1 Tax=Rhodohalobacter sulfatireducens TaxID=2911366 RepID=A0ABS9KBH4_9BACT|nr:glycosyltransferase family 4 protein [Rhodohalobacter sulfatireducens]MCG2588186.1 glycosyltransferase family 4 protein [Rhodohalobacter sulfatireducens]
MKRILYLTFYFRPDLCAGSFRNSPLVDELSKQIEGENIKIDVFTTSPNRYASFREDFHESEQLGNISIERIVVPSHESGIKDQILSFRTYFFEVLNRTKNNHYDLVFASSSRFFTSYLGYLIAKREKSLLYLDIRDLFSKTIKSISSNPIIKYFITPIVRNREIKVFEYATHINLISKGFRNDFTKFKNAHFSFYTHGVDPVFKKAQEKRFIKNGKAKKIVYAGNIGDGQGLHKIIPEAAELLYGKYVFRIIGDGGAKQKLVDKLRELEIKNVEMVEPMSRTEVVNEYRNADILLIHLNNLPIFNKVLPSKIFELAAVEKPILAGVNGYAQEFLNDKIEGTFLFNPGDVHGLIHQIDVVENFLKENTTIDNSEFISEFDRQDIKEQMAKSILKYLK